MPNISDPKAISSVHHTLCRRLDVRKATKHLFIAEKIEKALSSYQWAPAIISNENIEETYFDHHTFYKIISGIEFVGLRWGNEELSEGKISSNSQVPFYYLFKYRKRNYRLVDCFRLSPLITRIIQKSFVVTKINQN